MDIKDNKYKRIVDRIVIDKNLGNTIGLQIEQISEKEVKINAAKKRWLQIRKNLVILFVALLFTTAVIAIIFTSGGIISPTRVVKEYITTLENRDLEKAKQFVIADYDINQDYNIIKKTRDSLVYKAVKNSEDKTIRTVDVRIKYLKELDSESFWFEEAVIEVSFWLKKINGKWYIISRDTTTIR